VKILITLILVLLFPVLLGSCAFDLVSVKRHPATLDLSSNTVPSFTLAEEVEFTLDTGYKRKLNKATRWEYVGSLPQGNVFKTKDQIMTIEGSNIYEAYIVVMSDSLVGFYLPVEKTFSPLKKPLSLNTFK